jgi:two-component system, sensor histidine kinase and response regulator
MNDQPLILVVDDDATILESVADLLRASGYQLLMAANGVQAMRVLQYHTPDLIISDIMMPEMDGYQLFEAVHENQSLLSIPFIFLSAKGEQKDVRKGYGLGVDMYLTKPFEPDDLLMAVESRLKRNQEIQSATRSEVEATKQQLMNVFSHELRTPLSWIYGYMSLLQEGHDEMDADVVDKMLKDMQLGVERLVKLTEDLMKLVYIDSGVTATEISRYRVNVPVAHRIENAVRKLRPKSEKWNIAFTVTTDENLMVSGVPEHIEDIFERLIDNAIKFSKPDGRIAISSERDGEMAVFHVKDTGIGIDADKLPMLFQRFTQIDREKMEQQGTGVGLAIVGGLVTLHGGSIEVESAPDQGSTFTVKIPAVG